MAQFTMLFQGVVQRAKPMYRMANRFMSCIPGEKKGSECSSMKLMAKGCGKAPQSKDTKSSKDAMPRAQYPEPLPPEEREIKLKVPPECCDDPCPDAFPPFDLLYYKRSDKLTRKYQQTWTECPELLKKPKIICCFEKAKPPVLPKRKPKDKPKTACKPECIDSKSKCPSFSLEGCRKARKPPKCLIERRPSLCKPRKAPYPSFSECSRKRKPPAPPVECFCLAPVSMCDVWAYYHRMRRVKKPSKTC